MKDDMGTIILIVLFIILCINTCQTCKKINMIEETVINIESELSK